MQLGSGDKLKIKKVWVKSAEERMLSNERGNAILYDNFLFESLNTSSSQETY